MSMDLMSIVDKECRLMGQARYLCKIGVYRKEFGVLKELRCIRRVRRRRSRAYTRHCSLLLSYSLFSLAIVPWMDVP